MFSKELCRFELAIPLLQDVIKLAPALSDPYKTLGLCHEQSGNSRRALDFYMITAHMTPKVILPPPSRRPLLAP